LTTPRSCVNRKLNTSASDAAVVSTGKKIAVRNNTTIAALMKMNDLKKPSLVKIGSTIKVPANSEAEDEKEARASKTKAEKRAAKRSDGEDAELEAGGSQAKPKTVYYVVKKGDTLQKIAAKHKTTTAELMELNNIKRGDSLNAGRRIKVSGKPATETGEAKPAKKEEPPESQPAKKKEQPAATHYVVQKGDTLEKIALKHGTTIPALMKLNKMKKGDLIEAGRRIRVAAGPESEAQAAADEKQVKPEAKPKKKAKGAGYVVKKGDTMEKIAAAHNTTLASLLKLNNMKMNEPLLAGKTIKVPSAEE